MPELSNRRWEAFCQHFVADAAGNVTVAYSKAYGVPHDRTAGTSGHRLLKTSEICSRIADLASERARAVGAVAAEKLSDDIRTSIGRVISLDDSRAALRKQLGELEQVIVARRAIADPVHDESKKIACNCPTCLPGGATGHVVTRYKAIGSRAVKEAYVDTPLLAVMTRIRQEIRMIEQQVAQELGQWETKIRLVPATTEEWWANLTPEQREAEKARLQAEAARETVQ